MLQFMYNTVFGKSEGITNYTKHDGIHTIHYAMNSNSIVNDIIIKKKDERVFKCRLLGQHISILESDNIIYNFCENRLITSIVKNGKSIAYYPNGNMLSGNIDGTIYKNGCIESCEYNGKLYRRVDNSNLYIVYCMGRIEAYMDGITMNIIIGQGKYYMMTNGRIVCSMSSLDTCSIIHWSKNYIAILEDCYGYNPCNKINLLPEHYFNDRYFLMLRECNIIFEYNRNIVREYSTSTPRYLATKEFYILYEGDNVVEMLGYQPNACLINGNIHGLVSLGSEYYYHEGILQWIRNGSQYLVRYDDHTNVKISIFKDCCVKNKVKYVYDSNGFVSIKLDEGQLDIFYDDGIPKITTYSTVRNIEPIVSFPHI